MPAIDAVKFRTAGIHIDPQVHAAGEAYALVLKEGIPFREAYQRVAAQLKSSKD